MPPDRYTLTVNAEQARVIEEALELLARCHMGQFEHATSIPADRSYQARTT